MIQSHNIYIHVPFCISKCNYCAFFSHACAHPDWDAYADKIINEIWYWANMLGKTSVPTVFFGGGTPSLMPVKIFERIIGALRENFSVDDNCEITLESNPGTIDAEKLKNFISAGVNRISIGVQSFDDKKLKFLGRRHDAKTALDFINTAMKNNIRVSADFIYGLPGDTVRDVIQTCKQINSVGLQHCSMYELTLEPNTPFARMNLQMPSDDALADMYTAIGDSLVPARYEVSNYAIPGQECRHNMNVWDGAPYIGIGRGAAGRILINDVWYEEMGNGEQFEKLSADARAIERVITGLRTVRGVYLDTAVQKIINIEYVLANPDLIHITAENRLAVTNRGMLVLNDIVLNTVG